MVTFYRSLYYLPSLVGGSVAVALVWKQLFARKGLFTSVLANMDMSTINWFGNQKLALYPLILMSVWQFGSSMIIFAAGLKKSPVSYYEAARSTAHVDTRPSSASRCPACLPSFCIT